MKIKSFWILVLVFLISLVFAAVDNDSDWDGSNFDEEFDEDFDEDFEEEIVYSNESNFADNDSLIDFDEEADEDFDEEADEDFDTDDDFDEEADEDFDTDDDYIDSSTFSSGDRSYNFTDSFWLAIVFLGILVLLVFVFLFFFFRSPKNKWENIPVSSGNTVSNSNGKGFFDKFKIKIKK